MRLPAAASSVGISSSHDERRDCSESSSSLLRLRAGVGKAGKVGGEEDIPMKEEVWGGSKCWSQLSLLLQIGPQVMPFHDYENSLLCVGEGDSPSQLWMPLNTVLHGTCQLVVWLRRGNATQFSLRLVPNCEEYCIIWTRYANKEWSESWDPLFLQRLGGSTPGWFLIILQSLPQVLEASALTAAFIRRPPLNAWRSFPKAERPCSFEFSSANKGERGRCDHPTRSDLNAYTRYLDKEWCGS